MSDQFISMDYGTEKRFYELVARFAKNLLAGEESQLPSSFNGWQLSPFPSDQSDSGTTDGITSDYTEDSKKALQAAHSRFSIGQRGRMLLDMTKIVTVRIGFPSQSVLCVPAALDSDQDTQIIQIFWHRLLNNQARLLATARFNRLNSIDIERHPIG